MKVEKYNQKKTIKSIGNLFKLKHENEAIKDIIKNNQRYEDLF